MINAAPSLFYFCVYSEVDITRKPERRISQNLSAEDELNLIYFYPDTWPLDERMKHVGLTQGLVNFSRTFNNRIDCDNVHSQKNRLGLIKVEDSYWIAMNLTLGFIIKTSDTVGKNKSESKRVVEFLDSSVSDFWLKETLISIYETFVILNGEFKSFDRCDLNNALSVFIPKILKQIEFENIGFEDGITSIKWHPISKSICMACSCFMNAINSTFTQVAHSMLMKDGMLLWTDLRTKDARYVFNYFTRFSGKELLKNKQIGVKMISFGADIDGGSDIKFYIGNRSIPLFLYIYKYFNLYYLIFVRNTGKQPESSKRLAKMLEEECSAQILPIWKQIEAIQTPNEKNSKQKKYEFLLLNTLTNSSIKYPSDWSISAELSSIFYDLKSQLLSHKGCQEVVLKHIQRDKWVALKAGSGRELYIAFDKKDFSLSEIESEMKSIIGRHFEGLMF